MINFQYLIVKFKLNSSNNELVDNFPVRIQYYSFENAEWLTIYENVVKGGALYISREVSSGSSEETTFFNLIAEGKLPPMRIIPRDLLSEYITKQAVIGSSFEFKQLTLDGVNHFEIHFGMLYMIPDELILDSSTRFTDFLPVANFYPLTIEQPEVPPVPIQDLYTNIVSEIVAASETSADAPFKLSNISLKLKALIHEDGGSMSASLLNLENSENVNGDAISELVFDITPVNGMETNGLIIPNLIGLTETAVRKTLKKLGLKLNPVYQKKDSVVNGDSFKQFPTQGVNVQPNQLITVIFSKHE